MKSFLKPKVLWVFVLLISVSLQAQEISDKTFNGLKLRNIGPAFTSGRIADIAMHPDNENIWYVAVGSGGVWKTTNSGTTWEPIFDDAPVQSIGAIKINQKNPMDIWVGTGEEILEIPTIVEKVSIVP